MNKLDQLREGIVQANAYEISRDCGSESSCVTLSIENCQRLTIGPDKALGLIFRMYLEPATKVGAAMPEILAPGV